MARKKPTKPNAELVENDDGQDAKPIGKQVVEAKHTITYNKPIVVDAEPDEESGDDDNDDDAEFEFEQKPKRKKKTERELRNALRDRLAQKGVTPTSQLRIHIFKFENDNDVISGVQAEKAFCTKIFTSEDGIINGQHLDMAQKFGPGRYLFMVYMNNAIVTSFEERISAPSGMAGASNPQPVTVPDPSNPGQVIVQMPAQQTVNPIDPFAEFDKTLKMFERFQKVFGGITHPQVETQPQQPVLTPEQQLASTLLLDPEVKKKAVKSLLGSNGDSGETNTLELVLTHAESIGKAIEGIINGLFTNVQGLRGNNGTTQMAQTAFQNHGQGHNQAINQSKSALPQYQSEMGQESDEGIPQGGYGNTMQGNENQQSVSPEDQLLILVLDQCKRRLPAKIAAMRVLALADAIEQQAPWLSLYPVIEMFIQIEPDAAIAFIESYSEQAKEIASLPHAKEWTGQLQAELKASYDNGGDDGNQS